MAKAEEAYQQIRRDILDGALLPEQPLAVAMLTARYGFGWTPLREALSRLEREYLVTFAPNRGYRVAGVTHEELHDLQRARGTVEAALLSAAIRDGDSAWEKRVVLAHYAFSRAPALTVGMAAADLAEWEARHEAFHAALLEGGGALWLRRFAAQIGDQLHRHQRNLALVQLTQPATPATAALFAPALEAASNLSHHTALMQASLDRDEARALGLLDEHIGFTVRAVDELLRLIGSQEDRMPRGSD